MTKLTLGISLYYSNFHFKNIEKIELICNNFHQVARQMRSRHNNRSTLDINDEYDVQDLFHSLLTLYFDDIRPEERGDSIPEDKVEVIFNF